MLDWVKVADSDKRTSLLWWSYNDVVENVFYCLAPNILRLAAIMCYRSSGVNVIKLFPSLVK
jgi:hypothetical protein